MRIGVFTYPDSQQARALEELLNNEQGIECTLFDLSIPADEETLISKDAVYFAETRVDTLDVALLHGYCYDNPVVPRADDRLDYSVWQFEYLSTQQTQSYLFSLFSELSRRGVEVISPPQVHVRCFEKAHLLYHLKRSGVSVPGLIFSNAMDDVLDFTESRDIVWRPSTGRASWQLFKEKQRDFLIKEDKPPVLLAETKSGPFCRVFSLRGKPVLSLQMGHPNATPPENMEVLWEFEPSDSVHDACRLIYEESGIGWAQVMGVEGDDAFWVYDVDPDPLLGWLPEKQRDTLIGILAGNLVGNPGDRDTLLEADERSPLFLRRMLRILFDFEHAKYGE